MPIIAQQLLVHTEFTARKGRPFWTWGVPGWKIARRLKDLEHGALPGDGFRCREFSSSTSGNSGYIGLPGCGHSRGD